MEKDVSMSMSVASVHINPKEFDEFLPWASMKLGFPFRVNVIRMQQAEYTALAKQDSSSTKSRKGVKSEINVENVGPPKEVDWISSSSYSEKKDDRDIVTLTSIYHGYELVSIVFEDVKRGKKATHLRREIIWIIKLIKEFHPLLYRMTFKCVVDQHTINEISKLLNTSNISEIYLDDTFVEQANYDLLLNEPKNLQVLSLARCKLNDHVVKQIAAKLHYPLPASEKLSALILSTNSLTDKSARYLAKALRSNRKLSYLNLAGNKISDEGAAAILNVMLQFPITVEETFDLKSRYINYLKTKRSMLESYKAAFKPVEEKKHAAKKKIVIPAQKRGSENFYLDKAEYMLKKNLGDFDDPFADSVVIDDWRYCNGNNSLVYLNVAYNSLSHLFLKQLLNVLRYQNSSDNRLKGLKNVRIEGNPLPVCCLELSEIESYIETGMRVFKFRKSELHSRYNKKH